jgi:starvation-inducible DNA-binding protein
MTPELAPAPTRSLRPPRTLETIVADLLALGLIAKHAHWNVVGPRFTPLHALFDEVAGYVLEASDRLAERLRALGLPVDGRPTTVSRPPEVPEPPPGLLRDEEAIARGIAAVDWVARRIRDRLDASDLEDAVSRDLVVGVLERLHHFAWMLRAQT